MMPTWWPSFIWMVGVLNPCFMLPQLYKIWETRTADDISLLTLGLLILIQGAFSLHGHFIRDKLIKLSNFAATLVTLTTAGSAIYFQS